MKLTGRNRTQAQPPSRRRWPPPERTVSPGREETGPWPQLHQSHAAPFSRRNRPIDRTLLSASAPFSRTHIQEYCNTVARAFRPERIVLFGSYAYGQPSPDSDVDLLIILRFRGSDVAKAIQIRSQLDAPFPLDLLVRKPEFIAARLRERDMFIELVMTQGVVMYESPSRLKSLPGISQGSATQPGLACHVREIQLRG